MCKFFSFVTRGDGKMFFFDHIQRKTICKAVNYEVDSHTSICTHYHLNEDRTNKYEYNPLTKILVDDQINAHLGSDRLMVLKSLENFDFKTICPELIIKPIVNPFIISRSDEVSEQEIKLLDEWIKVNELVNDSVMKSVDDSVRDCADDSVRDCARNFVDRSVWASIWWDIDYSVLGYISSFFILKSWKGFNHLPKNQNPFQSGIDLWEAGLVPSFNGKTWRLHSGKTAKIVYEREV